MRRARGRAKGAPSSNFRVNDLESDVSMDKFETRFGIMV